MAAVGGLMSLSFARRPPGPTAVTPRRSESSAVAADDQKTFLIVGLGNPGSHFHNTRHNVGFACIDRIASKLTVPLDAWKSSHGADWCRVSHPAAPQHSVVLAKPQCFMNLSGRPIRRLRVRADSGGSKL